MTLSEKKMRKAIGQLSRVSVQLLILAEEIAKIDNELCYELRQVRLTPQHTPKDPRQTSQSVATSSSK